MNSVFSSAILYLPSFVLIYFFFIYILCVAGFHLSGTVKEPSNPLYSTDPDVPYQVSISFDRYLNQGVSCIGYRKSKSWRFFVKKKIGSNSFYENSNGTLLVMCELGYPFLHIFRKSVQKLKRKKKLVRKIKTIRKGTCDKKMFCTKILVKKIKNKGK